MSIPKDHDLQREELLAELQVLREENQMLLEKTEEFLILQVTGQLLDKKMSDSQFFPELLERVAVFLDIDYCAIGRFEDGNFRQQFGFSLACDPEDLSCEMVQDPAQGDSSSTSPKVCSIPGDLVQKLILHTPGHKLYMHSAILIRSQDETEDTTMWVFAEPAEMDRRTADKADILYEMVQKVSSRRRNYVLQEELAALNLNLEAALQTQSIKYQESEEQVRMLIEQSPNVIEIYDLDGLQVQVNRAYEELWGFDAEVTLGKFNVLHSEEVKATGLLEYVERAYAGESVHLPVYKFNPQGETEADGHGRVRWLSTRIYPLKSADGQVKSIVITHEDVSERKQAEVQLQESESKFKGLFKNSVDAMFILDNEGYYLDANPAAEQIFGYTHDEFCKMHVGDVVHPEDLNKSASFLHQLKTEGYYQGYEGRVITKAGEVRTVEASSIAILKDGVMIGSNDIVRDVTDRKIAETEKAALQEQVNHSQKLESLGTMIGGISHELNNILQSMFLYAGLVQDDLPQDGELAENLQHLVDDGVRARDIVRQILTFSRKGSQELVPLKVQDEIRDALTFVKASLPVQVGLESELDDTCPPILCDATLLHQIIVNLCNNASDAMPEGGTIKVRLTHGIIENSQKQSTGVMLSVADTGMGMSSDIQARIFDPFFTTKEVGKGSGLGLSVVHGIVEIMKGDISVDSEENVGTTIRIHFPDSTLNGAERAARDRVPETDHFSILIVDDEEGIISAVSAALNRRGHTVKTASSGEEALKLIAESENRFDIIVTDLSMPLMTGFELAEQIRALHSPATILLSSGNMERDIQEDLASRGIDGFIQKPWSVDQLLDMINDLGEAGGEE